MKTPVTGQVEDIEKYSHWETSESCITKEREMWEDMT
jgi:hypothetical protein